MHNPLRAAVAVADLTSLNRGNILSLTNTAEMAANRVLDNIPGLAPTRNI